MRGRPRIALDARFGDELRIWEAADAAGSARFECPTPGAAINLVLRLNKCRAELRAESGTTHYKLDSYIVRRYENVILIEERKYLDLSSLTDKYGTPIQVPTHPTVPHSGTIHRPGDLKQTHEIDPSRRLFDC